MAKPSKAIRDLRAAAKGVPQDTQLLHDELTGQSDRAVVILVGTQVEDAVFVLLKSAMRPLGDESIDRLFRNMAPLSSFSSKIEVAWALKLYGDAVKGDLNRIREIRNACAHSKQPLFFDGLLGAVVDEMETTEIFGHAVEIFSSKRERFVITAFQLIRLLVGAAAGQEQDIVRIV